MTTQARLADELDVELLRTVAIDASSPSAISCRRRLCARTHDGVAAAAATPTVRSEIELAYGGTWPTRGRTDLAVTDRRNTTIPARAAMRRRRRAHGRGGNPHPARRRARAAVHAYVVECSSFRLAWTEQFRADAALWLNLAPDHLNWHRSTSTYEAAKARLFDLQRPSDVAIGFIDDPIVMRHLGGAPARHVTFGGSNADYHPDGDALSRRPPSRRSVHAAPSAARHHHRASPRRHSSSSRSRRPRGGRLAIASS